MIVSYAGYLDRKDCARLLTHSYVVDDPAEERKILWVDLQW